MTHILHFLKGWHDRRNTSWACVGWVSRSSNDSLLQPIPTKRKSIWLQICQRGNHTFYMLLQFSYGITFIIYSNALQIKNCFFLNKFLNLPMNLKEITTNYCDKYDFFILSVKMTSRTLVADLICCKFIW